MYNHVVVIVIGGVVVVFDIGLTAGMAVFGFKLSYLFMKKGLSSVIYLSYSHFPSHPSAPAWLIVLDSQRGG